MHEFSVATISFNISGFGFWNMCIGVRNLKYILESCQVQNCKQNKWSKHFKPPLFYYVEFRSQLVPTIQIMNHTKEMWSKISLSGIKKWTNSSSGNCDKNFLVDLNRFVVWELKIVTFLYPVNYKVKEGEGFQSRIPIKVYPYYLLLAMTTGALLIYKHPTRSSHSNTVKLLFRTRNQLHSIRELTRFQNRTVCVDL